MSKINIQRTVENIPQGTTTVYTPVVEMIVNAIQAIDETGSKDGKVSIRARRITQSTIDKSLPEITGFDIEDNGVGFTDKHRAAFDELYTAQKIK